MNVPEHAVVLLVEDNADDVLLVRRAFASAAMPNPLLVVDDGVQAMNYLQGIGKFAKRSQYPLPDLIFLDLNLPTTISTLDLIRYIRRRPKFAAVPIVVLASTEGLSQVSEAYDAGANSYLIKPDEVQNAASMIRVLDAFWLQHDQPHAPVRPRPRSSQKSTAPARNQKQPPRADDRPPKSP